jgi:ubiquinone/menaquinone biosynthesis C-methylase UbiE
MSTSTNLPAPPSADAGRHHRRNMWAAVAAGWERHADFVEARGVDVTRALLEETAPGPGEHLLELACGAGDVGLAAAALVSPGQIVLSDVAAEMTAIAARRAHARDLVNVTSRTFGIEAIEADDGSFDVVVCREGLMFAGDPARAVREISRVLSPNGRVAIAVWGPKALNPWLGVVFDAVSTQLGRPLPPPGVPGPFALADADALHRLLADNGLSHVAVRDVSVPLSAPSFDVWLSRVTALAGPLATVLAGLPEAAGHELEQRLRVAVQRFTSPDGSLRFPGMALVASARAAAASEAPR